MFHTNHRSESINTERKVLFGVLSFENQLAAIAFNIELTSIF